MKLLLAGLKVSNRFAQEHPRSPPYIALNIAELIRDLAAVAFTASRSVYCSSLRDGDGGGGEKKYI